MLGEYHQFTPHLKVKSGKACLCYSSGVYLISSNTAGNSAFVRALREQMHQSIPQIRVTEITPPIVEEDSTGKLHTLDLEVYAEKVVKQLLKGVELIA